MIKRFCDICGAEIQGLKDGIYEERYTLHIEDPLNLTRLGGQLGKMNPVIEMKLQNCNNTDICRECLEKILIKEFHRRSADKPGGA
ncbi:MAG: hypothetical protein EOL86_04265 [Deltaproteobacteria bacterium]|nr:hypothetical protein [Deltaproteobacteria bacterium]